jgi:hypothetical protein
VALTHEILWESRWDADLNTVTVARVVEVFNVNFPLTGEIEANKIWPEDAATGLPVRGSVVNIYPFGPLVLDRISHVETISAWQIKCLLVYRRSLTGYSGGPRKWTDIGEDSIEFSLPIIQQFDAGGGVVGYEQFNRPHKRIVDRLIEVVYLTGITKSDYQRAIRANKGKYFIIDGELYIFAGGPAKFDGVGYTRASYIFLGSGPVNAIPAGSSYGNDVALPALGPWQEYSIDWGVASNVPPVVTATTPIEAFVQGGTPPLPGWTP